MGYLQSDGGTFVSLDMAMIETTFYTYSDGSGNTYVINRDKLEYKPVTRKESSSLVYSGGDPATVSLNENEFASLSEIMEKLLSYKEIHTQNRVMMSGLIIRESANGKAQAILRPGAREILMIETELNNLLKRK